MNGATADRCASREVPDVNRSARPKISEPAAALLAGIMFALSAPSRVQILGCPLDGPLPVGEITAILGMEQSAASHQLRVLREHTLAKGERDGKRRVHGLYGEAVSQRLAAALHHLEPRIPAGAKRQPRPWASEGWGDARRGRPSRRPQRPVANHSGQCSLPAPAVNRGMAGMARARTWLDRAVVVFCVRGWCRGRGFTGGTVPLPETVCSRCPRRRPRIARGQAHHLPEGDKPWHREL